MTGIDARGLFRRAELAFSSGRLEAARADLRQIGTALANDPSFLHLTALVEKKLGDMPAARDAFEKALRVAPADPAINSNFAGFLEASGERDLALTYYDKALAAEPSFDNARLARALLLQRSGRAREALEETDKLVARCPSDPRFHSARASILRDLGDLSGAAAAYDQSLRLGPSRPVALHGRARVALEQGESDAAARYRLALEHGGGTAEVHLGYAHALEAEGRTAEAIEHLARLLAIQPAWVEGHVLLARMRWEAGDDQGYASGLEDLVRQAPGNCDGWKALVSTYAGADFFSLAAETADRAVRANPAAAELRLLSALYHSEAGNLGAADRLFAALPSSLPDRDLHHASHLLRKGDYDGAAAALEQERERAPASISAWALTALVWRLIGDTRSDWLSGQDGLVSTAALDLGAEELETIASCLRRLHQTRAHPLGLSLRGGTQTRGRLFDRQEPEVRLLRNAIEKKVEAYWGALPQADPSHPLLRHRDRQPKFDGSWSVRLTGGGFHVAHMHTRGVLSSAAYLVLPTPAEKMEGWLEIGGAPANLNLALDPLHRVEPAVGKLALFPSYLFHGTRPFAEGERLTAAFDVVAR